MKVTIVRTDKKNVQHVSTRTIEKQLERMKSDIGKGAIANFRLLLPMITSQNWEYKDMHLMPRIYATSVLAN